MRGWSTAELQRQLATVRGQLESGYLSQALAGLLDVWAEARDPDLASAIFELDRVLAPRRAKIPRTSTGGVSPAGWLQRESAGHPADVSLLLETLTDNVGVGRFRQRLQRLQQRPPDPRVFRALVARLSWRHPSLPSYEPALVRHVDPYPDEETGVPGLPKVEKAAREAREARRRPVPPEARALLLASVAEAVRGRRRRVWLEYHPPEANHQLEELWREVVAHPDDDGPRYVYADCLADVDPNLARFVQLQLAASEGSLSRKDQTAMRKILRERLGDLLGPLGGAVMTKGVAFERGFLDAGTVLTTAKEAQQLGDDFRWGTATALTCQHGPFYAGAGVKHLHCAGTRYVKRTLPDGEPVWVRRRGGQDLTGAPLRQLAKSGVAPAWQVLQVSGRPDEPWDHLELPELRTLIVHGQVWPRLDAFPIRELVVPLRFDLTELMVLQPLERLVFNSYSDWQVVFDRGSPTGRIVFTEPTRDALHESWTAALAELAREVGRCVTFA